MDENVLDDLEQSTEFVPADTESVISDSGDSENVVESDNDSIDSSSDLHGDVGENDVIEYIVVPDSGTDVNTYYDEEIGAYPVYIVDDLTLYRDDVVSYGVYEDFYTTLNTTWIDYFSGVLANMEDTDYIAYSLRDYNNSSSSSYVDHYVLVYGVKVVNDALVGGTYNCIDIYRDSDNKQYVCSEHTTNIYTVPFPSYGSFGNLSDIRKGVNHNETWAILFAIGFAVVYSVCHDIFDYVMSLFDKRKS